MKAKKLNEVIQALHCCRVYEDEPCAGNCPYDGEEDCIGKVMLDALEHLKEYRQAVTGEALPAAEQHQGK